MRPSAIVVHFHVLKYLSFRFITGPEFRPVNQLYFECMEKTFRHRIIPTITLPAHASDELVLRQYRLEIIPGILTPFPS